MKYLPFMLATAGVFILGLATIVVVIFIRGGRPPGVDPRHDMRITFYGRVVDDTGKGVSDALVGYGYDIAVRAKTNVLLSTVETIEGSCRTDVRGNFVLQASGMTFVIGTIE